MRRILLSIDLATGLSLAAIAAEGSETEAGAPAPAVETAQDDPNERICRREKAQTGSRLAGRVCRTRAEWEAMDRGVDEGFTGNAEIEVQR